MKDLHPSILVIIVLFIVVPSVAALTVSASPPILKLYVANSPSDDERFFEQVTDFMTQLSGQTLSPAVYVGDKLRFFPFLASGYNIEEQKLAQELINFLFYTAKAQEHYGGYRSDLGFRFTPFNAENEYAIAQEYVNLAKKTFNSCKACQERYPDFVMYTLPEKEEDSSGLRYTGLLGF